MRFEEISCRVGQIEKIQLDRVSLQEDWSLVSSELWRELNTLLQEIQQYSGQPTAPILSFKIHALTTRLQSYILGNNKKNLPFDGIKKSNIPEEVSSFFGELNTLFDMLLLEMNRLALFPELTSMICSLAKNIADFFSKEANKFTYYLENDISGREALSVSDLEHIYFCRHIEIKRLRLLEWCASLSGLNLDEIHKKIANQYHSLSVNFVKRKLLEPRQNIESRYYFATQALNCANEAIRYCSSKPSHRVQLAAAHEHCATAFEENPGHEQLVLQHYVQGIQQFLSLDERFLTRDTLNYLVTNSKYYLFKLLSKKRFSEAGAREQFYLFKGLYDDLLKKKLPQKLNITIKEGMAVCFLALCKHYTVPSAESISILERELIPFSKDIKDVKLQINVMSTLGGALLEQNTEDTLCRSIWVFSDVLNLLKTAKNSFPEKEYQALYFSRSHMLAQACANYGNLLLKDFKDFDLALAYFEAAYSEAEHIQDVRKQGVFAKQIAECNFFNFISVSNALYWANISVKCTLRFINNSNMNLDDFKTLSQEITKDNLKEIFECCSRALSATANTTDFFKNGARRKRNANTTEGSRKEPKRSRFSCANTPSGSS